jgi:uncharacterized membrane protein YdjX (TVP38/TMEM64 family)
MPAETKSVPKKSLIKLAIAAAVLLAVAVAVLLGINWRTPLAEFYDLIRRAGPWAFFSAIAILPAIGVPSTTFTLTAGEAFGERMGMGAVVAAAVAATVFNLALTYWLARWALRPWLERLLARLGYRLPEVESGDVTDLIVVLRMTPGIPFFVQNYLLGLADVPVARYFWVSCLISMPSAAVWVLFGSALQHGKGLAIFVAVSLLIVLFAATHMVRRHWSKAARRSALAAEKL